MYVHSLLIRFSKQVTQSNFKDAIQSCVDMGFVLTCSLGSLWNSDELVYIPHKMICEVDSITPPCSKQKGGRTS